MANTSQTLDQLRQLIHKVESGRALQSEINKFGMDMYQLNPMSVTYQELKELKDNSQLQEFSFYIVEDYQLIHYKGQSNELNISESEKILFETLTSDTLKSEARSLTFPDDIVYFDFDGELAPPSQVPKNDPNFKGYVYRRVDESRNIDVAFDWRHATIRRWKMKDADAKKIGLPVDSYNLDLYLIPRPGIIYTGWSYGLDSEVYDTSVTDLISLDISDENDYVDEYFFFNSQQFTDTENQIAKIKNIKINQITEPDYDYDTWISEGTPGSWDLITDGDFYYHIPNVVFKRKDEFHSENGNSGEYGLPGFKFEGQALACSTLMVKNNAELLGTYSVLSNSLILVKDYGNLASKAYRVVNVLFTARRSQINAEDVEIKACAFLSHSQYEGEFSGNHYGNHFSVVDNNDNVIIDTDKRDNDFYNTSNLTVKDLNNIRFTGNRIETNGQLTYHLNLTDKSIKNKTIRHLTQYSDFEIEKDVDQSNYTLSLPVVNTGSSWYSKTLYPESNIYGIYRFDDLDGDGTTNIVLKKIDNPPQNFKFQLVPKSGINLVVTHNTDSNGIRLKIADQPDITLNGDNGDFAICEILNGNVTVTDYYQF